MKLPTTPGSESRRRKIAAWAARMGPEYMETLARRGGDATKRKGKEYFATIGRKGGLATRRRALARQNHEEETDAP
jgi:general stress protein YciG